MGNLATPKSVQKLQTALHAKAKAEAGYRFYALYDKISRDDILAHAYAQCRSNKGAPGIDGQDFADIEAYGVERWLAELALALRQETYRPEPIRRVFIPKANGKLRPLGISSVRDRVCMTAALLVLQPIFEADLPPEIYAYREGRNAQQAVVEVEELLFRGHPDVVDADLADYFGSIPHTDLLKSVARRIVDRRVLHLIKMWLECPVEETDHRGRTRRTTEARDSRRGIPQGSPLSPLLANLYMRRFVLGWKKLGLEQSLGTRLVTYADDLVILCRRGSAEKALRHLRAIMGKLKLTVNEEERQKDGTASSINWGPHCDTTTGRIKLPIVGAAQCVQPWDPTKSNGGATYQGVTATSIKVAYYVGQNDPLQQALVGGAGATTDPAAYEKTACRLHPRLREPDRDVRAEGRHRAA